MLVSVLSGSILLLALQKNRESTIEHEKMLMIFIYLYNIVFYSWENNGENIVKLQCVLVFSLRSTQYESKSFYHTAQ